jgi:hypothetical protein
MFDPIESVAYVYKYNNIMCCVLLYIGQCAIACNMRCRSGKYLEFVFDFDFDFDFVCVRIVP